MSQPKPPRDQKNVPVDLISRIGIFRSLRRRYYSLRRRKMRVHREKFRHVTERNASPFYRFWLHFRRGFHYVRTMISLTGSFFAPLFLPLLGTGMIILTLWFFGNYSVGLAVEVDGVRIGYVSSAEDYSRINSLVETRVKNESVEQTGKEMYLVDAFPILNYAIVPNDEFTSEEALFHALYTMASEYTRRSYGLFLDGELVATSRDRADLDHVISAVMEAYAMSEEDNLEILNYMKIVRGEYDPVYDIGYARILGQFKTGPDLKSYVVQKGDTLASISARSGISVPVLRLLNDIPVMRDVQVGQTILYGKPYLELVVKNTLTVTYNETEAYQTEYIYSDDHWEGTTMVVRNGSEGIYEVVSNNVYVNGQASSSSLVSRTLIKGSVSRQVLVGTKTIAPSGRFIFPLKNYSYISSRFGWRWLRGQRNYHRGLDIAASKGTHIFAADSGTVIDVGYESGGLGYFVRIDHGNGIHTIYGHCMQLPHVSKGQKVYQGQVIAYVGSTGNSTGNHLHFGVYNKSTGSYLDPEKYL